MDAEQLDQLAINTIRTLWIDAAQQPNSGYPGTPTALAPLVNTYWNRVIRLDPQYPILPNKPLFLGGSADLGPSNKTTLKYAGAGSFQEEDIGGKTLHFGIREHAMGSIVNGLALSKLRPFGAVFFVFSDYVRPAIRLSVLIALPCPFIFTQDAMGDGENGKYSSARCLVALSSIY